jgi:chemotaxis regulatin CheY-phosphate phosphatase CheZ
MADTDRQMGDGNMNDGPAGAGPAGAEPAGEGLPSDAALAGREMVRRLEDITEQLHQEVARLGGVQLTTNAAQQLNLLREELHGMGELIANTRTEIAGLIPHGAPNSRLTSASDELDAVVGATERAAVEIMGAAEHAQEAAQHLRKIPALPPEALRDLDTVEAAAVDIFMACSFQDLTGQRIRKVVQALTYIEKRVIALTVLWRGADRLDPTEGVAWDTRADAHLLNGPSDRGLRQDAIDSLLTDPPAATPASQDAIDALFA